MSQAFGAVARAMYRVRRLGVVVLAVLAGVAQAQVSDWATSNCPALQEPAQVALVRLCNGHAGCAMMVAQQGNSCLRVQQFLTTLDAAIGPPPPPSSGLGGLLGVLGIRRVTPEAVWQASLPEAAKALESRPEWKELIDQAAKAVPPGAGLLNEGTNARGVRFVNYASGTSSASPLNGPMTTFFANGLMRRGIWASGKFDLIDWATLAGQRITVAFGPDGATDQGREREPTGNEFVGRFNRDTLAWLTGTMTRPDGRREEGAFVDDILRQGKQFRADGTLAAEGNFDRNGLSVGRRFDASGTTVVENVDVARAQAEAAAAAREATERQRREQEAVRLAEEQRRAAEAAREQQAFRASLSSMNPGQMFNRADELQAAGNASRANEVRRALIERFPNHPLVATAAQQMAGSTATGSGRPAAAQTPSMSPTAQPVQRVEPPPREVQSTRAISGMPTLFESRPDPDRPGRHLAFAPNGCALSFAQPAVRGLRWSGACIDSRMQGSGTVLGVDYEKQPIFFFDGQIERGLRTQGNIFDFERRNGRFVGSRTPVVNGQLQTAVDMPFLDLPRPFLLALDDWQRQVNGENFLASLGAVWAPGYQEEQRRQQSREIQQAAQQQGVSSQVSTQGQPGASSGGGAAQGSSSTASCANEAMSLQVASQRWSGSANDVAARLGRLQKELFEGRCARHPEAAAYLAGANRMIGSGGNPNAVGGAPSSVGGGAASASSSGAGSGSSGKRSNVPEAQATNCLVPQREGGVINNCAFAVEYNYCVVNPRPGSWSALFDCAQGKSGSWQVGANSRAIMQTAGAQVAYFGCRYGPTLSRPDGISPADFQYNPSGLPSGRCKEWGAP